MFVVLLKYKKPIEMIDQHLVAHREFLDSGYKKDFLIASGPKNPRQGGVILSQLKNRKELEFFLKQDPFCVHDLAEYEIIEFDPVKYHSHFKSFL